MYRIKGWFPRGPMQMGGSGFTIILTPEWKELVAKSDLDQQKVNNMIADFAKQILEGHGRETSNDITPAYFFRISWGEWGPEHITVPGNACGLDIDKDPIYCRDGEVALQPHNVDTLTQASMILTIFTWIAEYLESEEWLRNNP